MASAVLPSWDKENPKEAGLFCTSDYKDLIKKNRVKLCEDLEPDRIWPHLRQLHVLDKVTEERIKFNKARPDVVEKLLDFIESGPLWHFHGFCRALALTDQMEMIPIGGLDPKTYEEGAPPKQLPMTLVKLLREHCQSNIESLKKKSLFDGDPDDDTINIFQCFVPVNQTRKSSQQQVLPIQTDQIVDPLGDELPPRVIRMYGDPGDGKTSLMMHIARCSSAKLLKLSDEELSSKCPPWNTLVYLSAPDIKGTVKEAIRDELGCTEKDADILMDHVETGDGTGVLIDSLDEVQDPKVIENIKHYVHQRKKKGGPTVLIAARTDSCFIDESDVDRTIKLQGFTEKQGLDYVKRYVEMCEVAQQPDQPPLDKYVTEHRGELKSVLTNRLRVYVFSALAVRGELDLMNEKVFNIPKLFGPLETCLLRREGYEVTDVERKSFYQLCMHGLLTNLREFPEGLLAKFKIAKAFYVFLNRSTKRGPDGAPVVYYSFSHDMQYEYFGSCYIQSLTTEQKKSLLLSICSKEQLRNVQYIVFQLLLQDWDTQKDLIAFMIRCMLIFQFTAAEDKVEGRFINLMSLRYVAQTYSPLKLDDEKQDLNLIYSANIWDQVNDAFENGAATLQESGWFGYLCGNRAAIHVVRCLQAFSVQQQDTLFEHTIAHLMPCRVTPENLVVDFFQVDNSRWGEMHLRLDGEHSMYVLCPSEAHQVLVQYGKKYPEETISKLHLNFNEHVRLGDMQDNAWTQDEWYRLSQELSALDEVHISVRKHTSLTGMFQCLAETVEKLQHQMQITVHSGQVALADLLASLLRCQQVSGVSLNIEQTNVVVPSGEDDATLRSLKESVCTICRKEAGEGLGLFDLPLLQRINWVTESGEKYVWSEDK